MTRKSDQDGQEVVAEEMEAPAAAVPVHAIDPAAFAALVAKVDDLEKQVHSLTLRLRHTI